MGEREPARGAALWRWWQRVTAALALLVLATLGTVGWTRSEAPVANAATIGDVALAELPREAREVMRLIRQGGPFPYDKDGTVFFNRERLLPAQKRGYYREYTVPTPGLRHRGARRIVCGGWEPTVPDTCYYTADHYASFRRIVP